MNRENEIYNVRVEDIIPNRFQPRLAFNQTELKELSDSIKVHGIIQPLILRRIADKFEIIAGERRYKAAVMAGLKTVPAIIMNMNDQQSAEVAVVENLQRKDLSAIEEAQSYKKLIDMGLTQEELAAKMGIAQPTIANKLRLLNLSEEVKQALLKNQISERHARSLLQIPDESLQINMLHKIISERMTVRQTDDEISKILGRPVSQPIIEQPKVNTIQSNNIYSNQESVSSAPSFENNNMFNPNKQTSPFDVDINKIKNESEDIIKEHKPSDIEMLMRKESDNEDSSQSSPLPKNMSLEDTAANVDMGDIVKPGQMAINPFQEIDTEIMNFDIPTPTPQEQNLNNPIEQPNTSNSIIDEFKQQHPTPYQSNVSSEPSGGKSISTAINAARNEAKKIEQLGFDVDTEEFDFEDMYQIIIKIKKD